MRAQKKYHYIYKTTNNLTHKYYIGMHSSDVLNDGYLGSGRRLKYSLNKYGNEVHTQEILEFCNSREELKSKEQEVVTLEEIAKTNCMNLIIGGGGYICTEKTREKMGLSQKKRLPMIIETRNKISKSSMGKVMSPESRVKMRNANLGKVLSEPHKKKISRNNGRSMLGKHHTEKTKSKLRKSQGHIVIQYNLNGDVIKKWDSANHAASTLKIRTDCILGCCQLKFGYKSAGGFLWGYPNKKINSMLSHPLGVKILQFDKSGIFIKEWNSISDASSKLKIIRTGISMCCNGKRDSAGGFKWKLKKIN